MSPSDWQAKCYTGLSHNPLMHIEPASGLFERPVGPLQLLRSRRCVKLSSLGQTPLTQARRLDPVFGSSLMLGWSLSSYRSR
jgi:hypothetical protein